MPNRMYQSLATPPSHCMASAHPVPAHSPDINALEVAVTTRWGSRKGSSHYTIKKPVDLFVGLDSFSL